MSKLNLLNKRGFGLTGGLWNRFGVTLIEAPIDVVSSALSNYFRAECRIDIFPADSEKPEARFIWQYGGHPWTIWWAFSSEQIVFTLAFLLDTKAIVLTHQGTSDWSELKIFDRENLVEHYCFGFDDYDPNEKIGDRFWDAGDWDLEIVQEFIYPRGGIRTWYRHFFCSLMRQVTEREMRRSLAAMPDEFGFLDATLQYYRAYLPALEETPLTIYNCSISEGLPHQSDFIRIDAVLLPKEAFYGQNILPVPAKVL